MTLTVSALSARYGRLQVCRDIGLSVSAGEYLIVLGANGAGKSSLLGALAGIVASSGAISLSGRRLDHAGARVRVNSGLVLVPEGRGNLFGSLTVHENLAIALRHLPRAERRAMLSEALALFPILAERGTQLAGMLSGGEQQMLALAVALVRRPKALLLDEPSQGLAPVVLNELIAAIGRLRSLGMALLIAEQNVRFAAALGDRFVLLRGGEIVHEGAPAELADHRGTAFRLMGTQ
ncbi:MAG: ABC transporter ATP-binding protein [Xanthobacteraceae bacterium]